MLKGTNEMTDIPKVYSPETIEPSWAERWAAQELYRATGDPARRRFSLAIPPPNVTGSLHIGHMLEHTEIDILMRWHRMRGEDVLWLPGMDHASIATQMIVEREIGREALPALEGPDAMRRWQMEGQRLRLEMGREKFLERCWQWKEESGGTIRKQLVRLGASVDWSRERFTMDADYSRSVVEVFVRLYEEGLIYRGDYVVNWCPRCQTAVSDLEVVHEERAGHLWFIRYPFEDGSGSITVATTRPETLLGDTAVAVNPKDARYQKAAGRRVILPLMNRAIPVVADEMVDPEFGTGAVKVTPAHDPNDFEIAQRRHLPALRILDEEARMTAEAGPYRGLDRYAAREAVLRDLKAANLLEKTEDYVLSIGACQRCKSIVEPLLSKQWFMKMRPLAGPAIRAVEQGQISITPDHYRKIYLDWMNNIHDWCISRQLWWGHSIPAWTCNGCGELIVAREAPAECRRCRKNAFRQDPDVLDTWFSSGLWPFATLGWPEPTPDLIRFYPNDLMIMGFDILFFWGARMIMLGLKLTKNAPFRKLHIHALVRDAERQKMSKTKGNVIDPLEVTEKYGTDAVRFALAISAAPGTDIAFSTEKIESYRAFANKIWNAARFILMNLEKLPARIRDDLAQALEPKERSFSPAPNSEQLALADRWVFSRLAAVSGEIEAALAEYRFHEAAYLAYHFFWHEFCDWYLEWVKPEITRADSAESLSPAWLNLARAFQASLHLLHPFMPFITEELWHRLPREAADASISLAPFALAAEEALDREAEADFGVLRDLVVTARNAEADAGLQKQKPHARVASEETELIGLFETHRETVLRLAGLGGLEIERGKLPADVSGTVAGARFDFLLVDVRAVDHHAERARLEKEKDKLGEALARAEQQLSNEGFLRRAPREVVEGAERRRAELTDQLRKVAEALERLN